ncbi:MAG TPA: ROK family protein [Kineosporiaceae bacterium]|nr:ROK family protein [Kineosporiaceae bacterium]
MSRTSPVVRPVHSPAHEPIREPAHEPVQASASGPVHPPSRQAAARPARQPALREHNLALVLGHVADSGPVSRARIAAATGLTKASVSSLVETLLEARLLAELGPDAVPARLAGAGRPGSALGLDPRGPVGIGVELNVDYVSLCGVDLAGAVRTRETVVGDLRGLPVPAALDRAAGVLRRAVAELGRAGASARTGGGRVVGVTVAVPGLVETGSGEVRVAPNLGWRDVPVLDELRVRAGLPPGLDLLLDNEANLAALAEFWRGGHTDGGAHALDTFVYVSGEVGVGAGVVLHGELLRGRHGFAGEIGHLPVPGADARCGCGSRGCLEQVAGQDAILRAAGVAAPAPGWAVDGAGGADAVAAAAAAGDARALAAIGAAGAALGTTLAGVLNLLDIDTVVLGGGYARLAPWLGPRVTAELRGRVLAVGAREVRVLAGRLGPGAATLGAALSVVRRVIAHPSGVLG